jgi:hypothetical protein
MVGYWELTDEQRELVEPVLRPVRREDNCGRQWHETRAVLNGVLWIVGSGAQWAELSSKYPPYQTCHRQALRLVAKQLHEQGKVNLDDAFVGEPPTFIVTTDSTLACSATASASGPHFGGSPGRGEHLPYAPREACREGKALYM